MHLLTYPYGLSLSSCQYFKFQQSKTIRGPVAFEALQKLKIINYCWRSIVMSQKRIAISKPLRNLGKEGLPVKNEWWWWFSIANFFFWETNEPPWLGLELGVWDHGCYSTCTWASISVFGDMLHLHLWLSCSHAPWSKLFQSSLVEIKCYIHQAIEFAQF